jgi:transposase
MEYSRLSVSYQIFIGIDVSKAKIDVVVLRSDQSKFHSEYRNDPTGYIKLWKHLQKHISVLKSEWLFCMEHTGVYTRSFAHFLMAKKVDVWLESGMKIKRSIGLQRGKNDKVDAHRIARYASRNHADAELLTLSKTSLEKLQDLVANRSRILKAKNALEKPVKELEAFDPKNAKMLKRANKQALKGLDASLKNIEKLINETIEEDPELKEKFDLATSVKSVGQILALQLLLATHGFTRMMDGRKIACHAGVAPFQHQSGSSIRGKNRTSKMANQQLKATLHMAALCAIRTDPEMKHFYKRKVEQGKNKMSVINAVRNKLLHRVISVVKRGYHYIDFTPQIA